jgi:hemolysin activation/secretion protein
MINFHPNQLNLLKKINQQVFLDLPKYPVLAIVFGLIISTTSAFAQSNAGALQQELEKQLPLPGPLPLPEAVKPVPFGPSPARQKDAVHFVLNGITFAGADVQYEAQLRELVKPWLSKDVTISDLESLTMAIGKMYQKEGIHVLVTLPPQEIKNGIVQVLITKAKLGNVTVVMPEGESRFGDKRVLAYIENANPIGETVNLQSLERVLMILNETPGVNVQGQITRGQKPAETDFQVSLTQPQTFTGKAELNNYGSVLTGSNQALGSLLIANPLGYGDQALVNAIASQGSQYGQFGYNFPVGYSGLRLGVGTSVLSFKDIGSYAIYPNGIAGSAWTAGVNAAYPLVRSQGANLNLGLNYDIKSYNNYLIYGGDTQSAYNIKDLSFSISGNLYDHFLGGATSAGSVAFVSGYLDNIFPGFAPSGQDFLLRSTFNKVTFSANRVQMLTSSGDTSLYIAASGQYASANLSSAEQFYLGGPYGVRAYPVAQGAGAQGALGTIELRQKLPQQFLGYAFFDMGIVQQFKNTFNGWQGLTNANNVYSLSGAGVGVKWAYKQVLLNAMVAWRVGSNPLYTQYGQAVNSDGTNKNPQAWLSGSFYF